MPKITYMGKYSGNPDDLPTQTYREGSVKFKEPETMKKLAIIANIGALIVAVFTLGLFYLRGGIGMFGNFGIPVGFLLVVVTMLPHEYLHAICFKEEVYVYTNLKQGLLFVVGPEAMTKGRFIFMSMLPNLVFGFIPYILDMIWPNLVVLGALVSRPSRARELKERVQRGVQVDDGRAELPVQPLFLLVHAVGGLSDGGEKRTGAPGRRLLRR